MGIISNLKKQILGDTSGAYESAARANEQAQQQLEAAKNIKTKSAEETMKEGQTAAGVAAANKAGEAKKQAKAAATMGNASRLQSALAGAGAASKAASEGFSDTANSQAQLASQKDLADKQNQINLAQKQADLTAQQGQQQIAQAEGEAQRKSNMATGIMSALAGWSDGRCKTYKVHNYIEASNRSKK